MKKISVSVIVSLVITLVFTIASLYTSIVENIYGTVALSFMTFLLSYVSIELPQYIHELKKNSELNKYQLFINNGITDFYSDFTEIQFGSDIASSHNIKLLLMYSRNFISNNLSSIREFLQKDGTVLDIALIKDDTKHPVYMYLTKKYDYTPNKLYESLDTFTRLIETEVAPYMHKNSLVNLYNIDYLPAYSLFMFDNHAYITLYKTAPQRTNTVPSFRIAKARHSAFFHFLSDDINQLIEHHATTRTVFTREGRQVKADEQIDEGTDT